MAVSASDDTCAPLVTGGYDCDFVDPPPDSLQCPVCLLPFRDPNLLSCCGHKGCASCIGRIKAAGHPCPLCQQPFFSLLDKQLRSKVLDLRVFCSKKEGGCLWKGELRDLETHSERGCAYVEKECRYGCGRRYQRRFLQNHEMEECPQRPPEVVTQSLILKMAERMDNLERAHCDEQAKLNQDIRQLQNDNASLRDDIQRLQDVNASLHNENEKLTRKVAELANHLVQETDQRKEDKKKLGRNVDELKDQVEHQSTTLRVHSQIVATHCPGWLMDTKGICTSPYPPTTIVMPQFSKHKRGEGQWYSQPFYSWPGGYKLCLSVTANGCGDGKGTHIAASVKLMKGENDHQLQWPFVHDVMYGILNWKRNENHVFKTADFKNAGTGERQRVTSQEMAEFGWGFPRFLPHSSLSDGAAKDTQYLHNDCLCLQVLKIEPPK